MQQAGKLAHPRTLNDSLAHAVEFEVVKQAARGQACIRATTAEPSEQPSSNEELVQKVINALKTKRKELRCLNCGEFKHPQSRCKSKMSPRPKESMQEN